MAITESQSYIIIKKKITLVHSLKKLDLEPKSNFLSISCVQNCGILLHLVGNHYILVYKSVFA